MICENGEMTMALVSVRKTETYSDAVVRSAVNAHFKALGIENDLHPDMKVLIKPNLLAAHRPERGATTHPAVVGAVIDWLREHSITDITVADSSGGVYTPKSLKAVYDACGYTPLRDMARLNEDTGYTTVKTPGDFMNRSFNIINPILEADYLINVAKLKTHGLTTVSGGVKNLFGAVPGLQKPELHFKYPNINEFCRMLVELALTVKPQLTVIDAVETMEGNGPLNGRLRHMGLTLASRDIFAQDYYAATLMGLDPKKLPIINEAMKLGLIKPEALEVTGDAAAPADPPYLLPNSIPKQNHSFLLRSVGSIVRRVHVAVPDIDKLKCVGCGKCAESCPMKIIKVENKKAGMSTRHCISCFCCQEMCPLDAVKIKHEWRLPRI
jgi:uncharacterized protein (DUF362 family)/Pyruvate/2-oxoacid:ferredoxin oxidoreductase delta subunit